MSDTPTVAPGGGIDLDATISTLKRLERQADQVARYQEAECLRALRDALPALLASQRDGARLDWLDGRLNWFTTQGPGYDSTLRDIRERIDAAMSASRPSSPPSASAASWDDAREAIAASVVARKSESKTRGRGR